MAILDIEQSIMAANPIVVTIQLMLRSLASTISGQNFDYE